MKKYFIRLIFVSFVFCVFSSMLCGSSNKKPSANNMTPYEYARYMWDAFVCGDGSLWITKGVSANKAYLISWEPCEDLSEKQGEESDVAIELIGMDEKYNMAVIFNIINNGSENLTIDFYSSHPELQVKLGNEWYPALNMYATALPSYNEVIVYPGESIKTGEDLRSPIIGHKKIAPPGRYRLVYSGTEPPAYLEFDLIEKDGVLSAVPAE